MTHENRHTPGPWKVKIKKNSMRILGADNLSVANISHKGKREEEQKLLDLRLIAAAPELLVALKNLLDLARFHLCIEDNSQELTGEYMDALAQSDAAILKARGRE